MKTFLSSKRSIDSGKRATNSSKRSIDSKLYLEIITGGDMKINYLELLIQFIYRDIKNRTSDNITIKCESRNIEFLEFSINSSNNTEKLVKIKDFKEELKEELLSQMIDISYKEFTLSIYSGSADPEKVWNNIPIKYTKNTDYMYILKENKSATIVSIAIMLSSILNGIFLRGSSVKP